MKCVILAAGEGKRMRPLTAHRPKVMLPVAGKPMLEHMVTRAHEAGFDDFLLVTHYQGAAVRDHFGNGRRFGINIKYVEQGAAGGTGHAVARLKGLLKGRFALFYGDALFDVKDLQRFRDASGPSVGTKRVEDASPYGLLTIKKGRLTGLEEKPKTAQPGWVNVGAYVLDTRMVSETTRLKASPRGELELTDVVHEAAQNGGIDAIKCTSWRDIGRPWDLLQAQSDLMKDLKPGVLGAIDPSVVLEGPVFVEKGARVRHHTVIEGPCIVQRDAKVGPHAYIRPSTVIGRGCHVGASVELKNTLLMERSNVPHLSYVGDSVIGTDCNLGAGTNVANLKHTKNNVRVQLEDGAWVDTGLRKFGVILGDDVKTGINTTLNVGAVLAQGVRVLPGRIVNGYVPPNATVA